MRCTQCGNHPLEPGFVEDSGESSRGYGRWVPGPVELGLFKRAKLMGKPRWQIDAYRCGACGHLELYAVVQRG